MLMISVSMVTGVLVSRAALLFSISMLSMCFSSSWSCFLVLYGVALGLMRPSSLRACVRMGERSRFLVFSFLVDSSNLSRSARPTSSVTVFTPSWAMCSRTSSPIIHRKLTTCSGMPLNFLRSSGSCVATPTGHTLRWHLRIMMQPSDTRGAVEKPHSSAPSIMALTTSWPVLSWPSVSRITRSRRSFITRVWCVSARPSSHGRPVDLIPPHWAAPVPPSCPEMRMWSALALATPAAMTPTPTSDTSLTLMRAPGLELLRS
mmetsp:Transcript_67085/g.165485  ORF Transcript_67085/g.165485 Transcript_67085/m.165485 type:complete len:261 (+) Transcript_67085:2542-3324(+)